MAKLKYSNKKTRRNKNMRGGYFTENEIQNLENIGFSEQQINDLIELNIPYNIISEAITTYHADYYNIIVNIAQRLMNENNVLEEDQENNDLFQPGDLDVSHDNAVQQVLPGDLDLSAISSDSGKTSIEGEDDISFDDDDEIVLNANDEVIFPHEVVHQGGKKRSRKRKNNKRKKTNRKIKGGAVFGNGYGSNCNDPNYNIYNTNLLKLFPYNPK
jgi:hypothetical protein